MTRRTLALSDRLHSYVLNHSLREHPALRELRERTGKLADADMQIAPEQGAFLTLFTRILGAKHAVEVGTFTGYSALCIARGLPADGKLICCDVSDEWTSIGRPYWEKAGVASRIDLRIAPASETLAALPEDEVIDFAFIDADKTGYRDYYEALLARLRPGGLIAVDNVLWMGAVIDPDKNDESTVAIRAFNDRACRDERFDCVMLPISDGLTLLRKR